ncbi:MAG: WbqC family protein [Bacteroidales bacterium]|nr:WbqC family protein [Bacteroidales bacterium]
MIVLPTTYFGPVSYYAALMHSDDVVIEANEYYVKQTLRNRCLIATNQGVQTLSINVQKVNRPQAPIRSVMLSDHGNWMHQHLYSLATYYGNSPFYEFYIDELREVMQHGHDGSLFGLNEALRQKLCEWIGIQPQVRYSEQWMGQTFDKGPLNIPGFVPEPYYQVAVAEGYTAFEPDMSILDLLFNMGPESILVLKNSWQTPATE